MATDSRGEVPEMLAIIIYQDSDPASVTPSSGLSTPSKVLTAPPSRTSFVLPFRLVQAWLPSPASSPWLTRLALAGLKKEGS